MPEKAAAQQLKTDLQALADALSPRTRAATDESKKSDKGAGAEGNVSDGGQNQSKLYIRGEFRDSCVNVSGIKEMTVPFMLVAKNPDLAFLTPPVCILCAYPNKVFSNFIEKHLKGGDVIYADRNSDTTIAYNLNSGTKSKSTTQYIPVVLNAELAPLGPEPGDRCGGPGSSGKYYWSDRQGYIDWLFVEKDGVEIPPYGRLIGSSNGYTVYTTCEQNFAEFVLAITEATLQSPQIAKVGSPAPPVVQTTTGR